MLIGLLWLVPFFGTSQITEKACFSVPGGFYEESPTLELYPFYQQHHIRFTTNGNRPTAQSQLYTEPLLLDGSLYSSSDISTIVNCPPQDFFLTDTIRHCIVIRAAVFDENDSCISAVATNSYFISALGCDTHGLPVFSICADSLDLFDYERGIFVPGIHYDTLRPYATGNYFMKGPEWERWSNFEFYELDNEGVNQEVGLRTHGRQSRWRSQKGYSIFAREEYGKNRIDYKFFENNPLESFKDFMFRPFMASFNGNGCVDYLSNRMAKDLGLECLDSRPGVLFLNGEYWGVYYIQEKPDEHYLEDHLGVDKDRVNIISNWYEADCGSLDNFTALYDWMEQADLSDEEQYAYVSTQLDISNFIDYYIFEIFTRNLDWPANNVRLWQEDDGPWRCFFYDGDGCLQSLDFDAFANATYDGDAGYPASRKSTLFFRRLLENDGFFDEFGSRFYELISTVFSYQNTQPYFDSIKPLLQGEVPNQIRRFNFPSSYATWEGYSTAVVNRFLRDNPSRIMEDLYGFLSAKNNEITGFRCYPNPFSDEIRISVHSNANTLVDIIVFDLLGREVFSQPCHVGSHATETTIHPRLTPGIYFLKIGNHVTKIVRR